MASSPKKAKNNGRGKDKNARKMHANSLENLKNGEATRWKPGQPGNPEGSSITFRQKMMMPDACPFDGQGRPWLEALAEGGMRQALTIPTALSNLQDRHEGKVTIPIGGDRENPVYIINVPSEQGKRDIERVLNGERT